jgi:predicted ester cyclase
MLLLTRSLDCEHRETRLLISPPTDVIRSYYAAFNQRRWEQSAACLAPDAALDQFPVMRQQAGPVGYLEFVERWLAAFPDATFTIESISSPDAMMRNVHLLARGTHAGVLKFGGHVFPPSGVAVCLRMRELLQIRQGVIVFASLSYDMQDIVRQLTRVDSSALLRRLERLRTLGDELARVQHDEHTARGVIDRIGLELDGARHVVRPYYK